MLFPLVSASLPPSSSCQRTMATGSTELVFSKSAAFLHASPPFVCHGVQVSVMILSFPSNPSCLKGPSIQPSESKCESPTSPDMQLRTKASHERSHANVCMGSQSGRAQSRYSRTQMAGMISDSPKERARAILILAPLTNSAKPIGCLPGHSKTVYFSRKTNSQSPRLTH